MAQRYPSILGFRANLAHWTILAGGRIRGSESFYICRELGLIPDLAYLPAIGIAAAGVALMYPEAGIVLIVAAVVVLLFGVRIEGWHVRLMPTWRSRVHTWGPWILIIGGPVLGTLWLVFRPPIAGPIAWNFQKTGYAIQLEWALERVGGPLKFYVPGFIFHGENGSEPLYQVKAFVTIDQNKKVIPLYIAVDGQWIQFSQIEGNTSRSDC